MSVKLLGLLCRLLISLCILFVDGKAQKVPYSASKHGANYMFNYYIPPAPSTTPWAPAWSSEGDWIAVAMYGSVWRVDPRAGTALELTYNSKYHSSPAISPDGEWLVYTADNDGGSIQLETLSLKTGETLSVDGG